MIKDSYKALQGVVRLWCWWKWGCCPVECAPTPSTDTADVTAVVGGRTLDFVFAAHRSAALLHAQIQHSRQHGHTVYMVTGERDIARIPAHDADVRVINVADRHGQGNVVEEL